MATEERLQVLGSFWSVICHTVNLLLLADFSGLVETYRTASWERTERGDKSVSEVIKMGS